MDSYKDNLVSIVMGSQSDWPCMKSASIILKDLNKAIVKAGGDPTASEVQVNAISELP